MSKLTAGPPLPPEGVTPTVISASYEITVNVGAYEKIVVREFVNASLAEHTDLGAALTWANDAAKWAARAAALPAIARRDSKIESIWSNLPADLRAALEGEY